MLQMTWSFAFLPPLSIRKNKEEKRPLNLFVLYIAQIYPYQKYSNLWLCHIGTIMYVIQFFLFVGAVQMPSLVAFFLVKGYVSSISSFYTGIWQNAKSQTQDTMQILDEKQYEHILYHELTQQRLETWFCFWPRLKKGEVQLN